MIWIILCKDKADALKRRMAVIDEHRKLSLIHISEPTRQAEFTEKAYNRISEFETNQA